MNYSYIFQYSNHTLRDIFCFDASGHTGSQIVKGHIRDALSINSQHGMNPPAAGRAKVIATQLNSAKRRELCRLQGIEYSYPAIFAGIDPVLLPDLLALVTSEHGLIERYRMQIELGPGLFSLSANNSASANRQMEWHRLALSSLNRIIRLACCWSGDSAGPDPNAESG